MISGIAVGALNLLTVLPPQVPVFASATELVYVVVNVGLKSGEPVTDLGISDFVMREDGSPRPIAVFSRAIDAEEPGKSAFPVDVALLLDTSSSMRLGLTTSRALALQLLQSIPKATTRRLVTFNDEVRVWAFDEAKPEASLEAALALAPNAGSRLFDGILATLELPARRGDRRVIVSVTDGLDEGSQADRATAEKAAGCGCDLLRRFFRGPVAAADAHVRCGVAHGFDPTSVGRRQGGAESAVAHVEDGRLCRSGDGRGPGGAVQSRPD